MKLAILFWCYKDPSLCADRLRLLRRFNPETKIFVLFGGRSEDVALFESTFEGLVDDFYVFREPPPPGAEHLEREFRSGDYWKYVLGDLQFGAWHRDRGHALEWDTVVVVQWDMLVYGPLEEAFASLGPGECLFSGLRPVREIEARWAWVTKTIPRARAQYLEFLEHVRERYGYEGEPEAYLAVVTCFPRAFLERFSEIERPELGFLEYRLPIYARAFGIPICTDHPFRPWWAADDRYHFRLNSTLRGRASEIWAPVIRMNLMRKDGARVFHPYWRPAPIGFWRWTLALLDSVPRILVRSIWWLHTVRRPAHVLPHPGSEPAS